MTSCMTDHIRIATVKDIPAITRIYNEAIEEGTSTADLTPQTPEQRQAWLTSHETPYAVFVAEEPAHDEVAIVGFGALSVFYDRPGYDGVADLAYYLASSARGRGLGGRLLDHLIHEARDRGMRKLIAVIFADNDASTGLAASRGFTRFGLLPDAARSTRGMHAMSYWSLDL